MSLATLGGKLKAQRALEERRKNRPEKIDNSRLYAGSPMYFYCISCGHESDIKPESFTSPVRKLCPECQSMKDLGWLE